MTNIHKNQRGNSSQFFVAGELCRRGLVAVVTMGNTPNTDILCSNLEGTKFVHIQVKTFNPGKGNTVAIGKKSEKDYGDNFIWVLGGIPNADSSENFEYFIIPSPELSKNVSDAHRLWLLGKQKNGAERKDSDIRTVHLPPKTNYAGWSIEPFRNRWDIIEDLLDN
jgi:hypothetical protein